MHTGLWKTVSLAAGGLVLLGAVGMAHAEVTLVGDTFDITRTPTGDSTFDSMFPMTVSNFPVYGTGLEYGISGHDSRFNEYTVVIDIGGPDYLGVLLTAAIGSPPPVSPMTFTLSGLEFLDGFGGAPTGDIPRGLSASDGSGTGTSGANGGMSWAVSAGNITLTWDPSAGNLTSTSGGPFGFKILKALPSPEPASLALLGLGLTGLGFAGRHRGR